MDLSFTHRLSLRELFFLLESMVYFLVVIRLELQKSRSIYKQIQSLMILKRLYASYLYNYQICLPACDAGPGAKPV